MAKPDNHAIEILLFPPLCSLLSSSLSLSSSIFLSSESGKIFLSVFWFKKKNLRHRPRWKKRGVCEVDCVFFAYDPGGALNAVIGLDPSLCPPLSQKPRPSLLLILHQADLSFVSCPDLAHSPAYPRAGGLSFPSYSFSVAPRAFSPSPPPFPYISVSAFILLSI